VEKPVTIRRRESTALNCMVNEMAHLPRTPVSGSIMMINRLHLILLLMAVTLSAACADSSTGPATHSLRASSGGTSAQLTCTVRFTPRTDATTTASPGVSAGSNGSVSAGGGGSIACRSNARAATGPATSAAASGAASQRPGVAADSILEDQGTDVSIQFDSVQVTDNVLTLVRTLTAWTSVTNMLPEDIGTSDGVTPATNGTRVFFNSGPSTLSGVGVVTVGNATGTSTFTAPDQQYFEYDGIIGPGASSGTIGWQFNSELDVNSFTFGVGVDAIVP
jgi:hypothetical protein